MEFLEYVCLFINAIDLAPYITGTAQPKMNQAKMNSIPVALPPQAEQKRIVAKVDELMALCDELKQRQARRRSLRVHLNKSSLNALTTASDAKTFAQHWRHLHHNFDRLYDTPETVNDLRQSILQLAVQGKLVPQDLEDEPAVVLLERIDETNQRLVEHKSIRRSKISPAVDAIEFPYELPAAWQWTVLDRLCYQITDGVHHTPTYIPEGVPFLSVKDISGGPIDLSNTRFISAEEHCRLTKRCCPELNDLLLTKVGTTGIAKVIDVPIDFSIFVSLALLKIPIDLLDPLYVEWTLNSPLVKQQSKENTQGVGNKNLVLKKIRAFMFPLPPLAEQQRIVSKVDELMGLCDALDSQLTQARHDSERLMEAFVRQLCVA